MRITEQDIRRLAIGRLRLHHRMRPRREWNGIDIVDRAHYYQNITIDARLTYVEPDGKRFIATVEATSLDKRAEVDFRFNYFRWLAESLMVTLFLIGSSLLIAHWEGINVLYLEIIGGVWSLLLLGFLLLWSLMASLMQLNPHRYRYIYAIEQFKQFYADEQWIAISSDIFPGHRGRKWRELQRQCMRYGFGLMQVEENRKVRLLIMPKRGDFFEGKRQELPGWLKRLEKAPVIGGLLPAGAGSAPTVEQDPLMVDPLSTFEVADPEALPVPVEKVIPRALPGRPTFKKRPLLAAKRWWQHLRWLLRQLTRPAVVRSRPGYFTLRLRWWIPGALGVAMTVVVFYQQRNDEPIADLSDNDAAWPLEELEADDPTEAAPYDDELEAELNDFYRTPLRRSETPYVLDDELTAAPDEPDEIIEDVSVAGTDSDVFFYRITDADTTILFDCLRLPATSEALWVIEYNRYPNFESALNVALELHRVNGPGVNISRADCLQLGLPGYSVFLGDPTVEEGDVNFRYRQYRQLYGEDITILQLQQ